MRSLLHRKKLTSLLAWLAVLGILFQVFAFDHQVAHDPAHVSGAVGSSDHAMHCHGDTASCSVSSGAALPFVMASTAALAPELVEYPLQQGAPGLRPVLLATDTPPPQLSG